MVGGLVVFAISLVYCAVVIVRRFSTVVDGSSVTATPVIINVVLLTAFAAHHSLFARTGLKARIARIVPPDLERTLYVWIASLLFIATLWWWQVVPCVFWHVQGPASWLLYAAHVSGGVIALATAPYVDVLELAGLRGTIAAAPRPIAAPIDRGPYAFVRHPLYLAWVLGMWPAPLMTGTRFLFALLTTVFLLVAIPFEERDLRRTFGAAYDKYAAKVRYRIVPGVY